MTIVNDSLPVRPESASAGFNDTLSKTMNETITGILGVNVATCLQDHLLRFHGITPNVIPYRLEIFGQVLDQTFGRGSMTIEKAITRRLYSKLSLHFIDLPQHRLSDYVEDAKRHLEKSGDPDKVAYRWNSAILA